MKTNAHVQLFYLLPPKIWVARDQTQPGSFSREREEPGNEVGKADDQPGYFSEWPKKVLTKKCMDIPFDLILDARE